MMTELEQLLTNASRDLVSVRSQLIDAEASVKRLQEQKLRLEGAVIALSQLKNMPPAETKDTE